MPEHSLDYHTITRPAIKRLVQYAVKVPDHAVEKAIEVLRTVIADVRVIQRYIAASSSRIASGAETSRRGALYYEALAALARLVLPYVEGERGAVATLTPARVMKIVREHGIVVERGNWKCTGFWKLVGTFTSYVTVAAGPIQGWRYTCSKDSLVHALQLASSPAWWRRVLRDAFVTPRRGKRAYRRAG